MRLEQPLFLPITPKRTGASDLRDRQRSVRVTSSTPNPKDLSTKPTKGSTSLDTFSSTRTSAARRLAHTHTSPGIPETDRRSVSQHYESVPSPRRFKDVVSLNQCSTSAGSRPVPVTYPNMYTPFHRGASDELQGCHNYYDVQDDETGIQPLPTHTPINVPPILGRTNYWDTKNMWSLLFRKWNWRPPSNVKNTANTSPPKEKSSWSCCPLPIQHVAPLQSTANKCTEGGFRNGRGNQHAFQEQQHVVLLPGKENDGTTGLSPPATANMARSQATCRDGTTADTTLMLVESPDANWRIMSACSSDSYEIKMLARGTSTCVRCSCRPKELTRTTTEPTIILSEKPPLCNELETPVATLAFLLRTQMTQTERVDMTLPTQPASAKTLETLCDKEKTSLPRRHLLQPPPIVYQSQSGSFWNASVSSEDTAEQRAWQEDYMTPNAVSSRYSMAQMSTTTLRGHSQEVEVQSWSQRWPAVDAIHKKSKSMEAYSMGSGSEWKQDASPVRTDGYTINPVLRKLKEKSPTASLAVWCSLNDYGNEQPLYQSHHTFGSMLSAAGCGNEAVRQELMAHLSTPST